MAKRKKSMRFSTKIVVSAVVATTLFTIGCFWLAIYNIDHFSNVSLPAELTALFFAFWTIEIVMLASLDKTKIKNKYEKEEDKQDVKTDQP